MIFDRKGVNTGGTHIYYISFYLKSHRFHTKQTLIYPRIREEKRIETIIRTNRVNMAKGHKYEAKLQKDQTSCIQNALHQIVTFTGLRECNFSLFSSSYCCIIL